MGDDEDEAPGWDAIEAAFARLYPGQDSPHHWATVMSTRVSFGGPEVLDGLSAYRASDPAPHWHWVTYGLTELYGKDSDDPEWSGWGYELTMRVARDHEDDEPSTWPMAVIKPLANWAHDKKRALTAGDWFDTGRPIAPDDEACALTGVGFIEDPQLPPLGSPHGRVEFVEVIGLHPDEMAFCTEHDLPALLLAAGRPYTGEFNVASRGSFV